MFDTVCHLNFMYKTEICFCRQFTFPYIFATVLQPSVTATEITKN